MKRLREQSNLSEIAFEKYLKNEAFLIRNAKDIQKSFEKTKEIVANKAKEMFPYLDQIPDVNIQKGTNPALARWNTSYHRITRPWRLAGEAC